MTCLRCGQAVYGATTDCAVCVRRFGPRQVVPFSQPRRPYRDGLPTEQRQFCPTADYRDLLSPEVLERLNRV